MRTSVMTGLVVLALVPARGIADPDLPMTAARIIERVAKRSAANTIAREGLAWTKTEITYDTGRTPERRKSKKAWDIWITDGVTWQQKVAENDRVIENQVTERQIPDFTASLASLYRYELAYPPLQKDPVSGAMCWAVRFSPSPGAQPSGIKEEVAGLLTGTMYIDEHGYWIRYAEGKLSKQHSVALVLGRAHELSFTLQQIEELGAVMPNRITLRYRYSALHRILTFRGQVKERKTIIFSDFRLL